MSTEHRRFEAQRWLDQAEEDLEAARVLLRGSRYAQACFYAQQSAEKAVKAVGWLSGRDLWGHSLLKLSSALHERGVDLRASHADLAALDRLYIPTRYPNGVPDVIPQQAFFQPDAEDAIVRAERVIECVREAIEGGEEESSSGA